jgi:hypothetical protein
LVAHNRKTQVGGIAALLLQWALLTGCGGVPTALTATAPATTPAPTLTGDGTATLAAGTAYSFKPIASVTAGALLYRIANKPPWAAFDNNTGALTGTPASADIGTYANVTISATGTTFLVWLASFTITVSPAPAPSGSAALSWTPPTQNTDGSPLTNLAGYVIYYGNSPIALDNRIQLSNPGLTAYTVSSLASGTYYFAITAYSDSGAESALSNIATKSI